MREARAVHLPVPKKAHVARARFQAGGIDIGTLRELKGELKQTLIDMEETLESFYSRPEFAEFKREEKIHLMQELMQIKLATAENLKARGDLPESIFQELLDKYRDELDKLSQHEATTNRLLEIIKTLRGLVR